MTLWGLRDIGRLLVVGCFAALRRGWSCSLKQLRVLELVIFGSVLVHLSLLLATRLAEFAAKGDATSAAAVHHHLLAAWCVLIFIYGIFLPNTWKRGALVLIASAIIPYGVLALQRWRSPDVA